MQNIGYNDSGYVIAPPQPSSAVSELCLSQGTIKYNKRLRQKHMHREKSLFCHQDAGSNRLGRNEVNTKDKP